MVGGSSTHLLRAHDIFRHEGGSKLAAELNIPSL